MDSPPDTVNFLILGYALIGAIGMGYITTLILRQRNLKRDIEVLNRIQDDE